MDKATLRELISEADRFVTDFANQHDKSGDPNDERVMDQWQGVSNWLERKLSAARKRYTCSNCKCHRYPDPAKTSIEPGDHFLCETCDDAYTFWSNRKVNGDLYVDDFLRTSAARSARSKSKGV
jgi:RNase P subunit RPR2